MQDRAKSFFILIIIPLLLYVVPLPFTPLMEPDEARYSSIPSAMNVAGDYVTPRLKAAVYFEKPPLCYWATAAFFRLLGENEFSSRLFAALCAWGCILLTYRMGLFFHGARTGLYAAAVLSTFLYHAAIGRLNILDMPLAFFVCLAIWSGFRYFSSTDGNKDRLYLLYLFSGLAFLTKGLIGIAFPFGVMVVWLLISRRWRDILGLFSPMGIAIFLAVSLPWLILVQRENPDFFRFFFIQEHLLRYATRMHDRYEPFYFYLPIVLAGTLPWCAFLPEALKGLGGKAWGGFGSVEKRFLLTWAGLIFLFFSLSSSKLIPYIAPIFPPLALLLGHIFRRYEEKLEGWARIPLGYRFPIVLQSLLFMGLLLAPIFLLPLRVEWAKWWPWILLPFVMQLLILLLPIFIRKRTGKGWFWPAYLLFSLFILSLMWPVAHYLTPFKSALPISQAIKNHLPPGAALYQYGISLYGIDFYTGMRTPIVDDIGELSYGSQQLPHGEKERYFLTSDSFFPLIRDREGIYCATERGAKLERLKKEVPDLQVLWHNEFYYLLRLR